MKLHRLTQLLTILSLSVGSFPFEAAVAQTPSGSSPELEELQEFVLSSPRLEKPATSLPIKIDIVESESIELQQSLATNPTEILANLIPSYSPSRQKLTSSGESFRGRRPLFLIDGVPQSNPLRDSRRDGITIDMELIERIEVVFGANAIQGLGATGGIINYITKKPPKTGELLQRASFSISSNDNVESDSVGWRAHYTTGKRVGDFDFLGAVSFEKRGLLFDADNRPIGIDNVQGDIADSESVNFFGKTGWEPDENQRLQLTVSKFRIEQDGDFISVSGDRSQGIPATSRDGQPEGIQPINDVATLSLDYSHRDALGGNLAIQGYYQDFSALFGGGTFGTFQDPEIAPVGELFDQSENNSEKFGARLTYGKRDLVNIPLDLVTGFDFLRDKTFQKLAQTNRNWVPVTKFFNYAPFAQLDYQPWKWASVSGGLRWEIAELDVPGFSTIAGNRSDFQSVSVEGGSPNFDEPLFNVGLVLNPVDRFRLYGSFAEAFTMPDVGRVLRGISEEGTAVEEFLDLEPIVTDNLEFGGSYTVANAEFRVTYFESESSLGSRLVPNEDDIFEVRRQPTQTKGWELSGLWQPVDWLTLNGAYSRLQGSFDGDGDGTRESDLGASDIGPDRLNFSADFHPQGRFSGRIQTFTFLDETFRDGSGSETARFEGYTTVDASISADFQPFQVSLSVSNLLDNQYITFFSQAATTRDDRFFSGRGRNFTLRVSTEF